MNWKLLAFVWCVLVILNFVIYPAVMLLLAQMFRTRIVRIRLGTIPHLCRCRVQGVLVEIGLVPISTTFNMDSDAESTDAIESFRKYRYMHELPLWQQLLLITAGLWTSFAVALLALHPQDFLHQVAVAIPNLFRGAIHPRTEGQLFLKRFVDVMDADPRRAAGILAAILATWNSIPYLPSPTYVVIHKVIHKVTGKSLPSDFNLFVALPLMAPWLVPCIGWAVAVAVFVFAS